MMNKFFSLLAVISLSFASNAQAAFVGAFDVANWSKYENNDGSIDISGAPDFVKLTSSDAGNDISSDQDFLIAAETDMMISFNWEYETDDSDSSSFDPFGYLINGVFNQLTVDDRKEEQNGQVKYIFVEAGDIFGFRAHSEDSGHGAAITEISDFEATPSAVPVPAAIWLMGAPLLGLLGKKRKVAA